MTQRNPFRSPLHLIPGVAILALVLVAAGCSAKSDSSATSGENKPSETQTAGTTSKKEAPMEITAPPDVAAPPEDAERTASGLASKVLQPGTGEKPNVEDKVQVHYSGWTTDGKMFDSSVARGQPAAFPLRGVIKGWTEGLQLMQVGEKRRLWIPEELAYKGSPGRPQGMLVFDVELLDIQRGAKPVPAPADVAEAPADAEKTASGLRSKLLSKGSSATKPGPTDRVTVHYTGWTTDGNMFDSSVSRGEPATFPLDQVIPGWSEGVQLMTVGEKRRIWVPEALAYQGRPGRPAGTLVFDIELLDVRKAPAAPSDVAAPPADAVKTASGLASKVLQKGTGKAHPKADSKVKVHYTGWTTNGKMFDSSVERGEPITFPLNAVIPGWTEGVQLMVAGEKRRLWIPQELAYQGQPGAPAGMLVFDVELLEIAD